MLGVERHAIFRPPRHGMYAVFSFFLFFRFGAEYQLTGPSPSISPWFGSRPCARLAIRAVENWFVETSFLTPHVSSSVIPGVMLLRMADSGDQSKQTSIIFDLLSCFILHDEVRMRSTVISFVLQRDRVYREEFKKTSRGKRRKGYKINEKRG